MERSDIALKTSAGLDIYTPCHDGKMAHSHLPVHLESFYVGKVLTVSELSEYIAPGEVFETSFDIFVKGDNGIRSFSKESLYVPAFEVLVSEVNQLQSITNFALLRVYQKKRVIEFLKELLFNMSYDPSLIRIPIFATYNYNGNDCISQEDISQYVEINFNSQAWQDFLEKIAVDQPLRESAYVYSTLVKQMVGKKAL